MKDPKGTVGSFQAFAVVLRFDSEVIRLPNIGYSVHELCSVKSSKSLNKKGQTEPKILKKPRVERLIPREQVTKTKAWIIDTTSRAEDESLEWLNHLDFTAMGEGFLRTLTSAFLPCAIERVAWENPVLFR